jgi:integrative and conjugative element protein (TIGR02256 family)
MAGAPSLGGNGGRRLERRTARGRAPSARRSDYDRTALGTAFDGESARRVIVFEIGHSGQSLQIIDSVLQHFDRYRQVRFWQREAGGLLFARFKLPTIEVVEATGPRRTDRRTRCSYSPDVGAERSEIEQRFARGLHFVGCWHTHPEDVASPSHVDIVGLCRSTRWSSEKSGLP